MNVGAGIYINNVYLLATFFILFFGSIWDILYFCAYEQNAI